MSDLNPNAVSFTPPSCSEGKCEITLSPASEDSWNQITKHPVSTMSKWSDIIKSKPPTEPYSSDDDSDKGRKTWASVASNQIPSLYERVRNLVASKDNVKLCDTDPENGIELYCYQKTNDDPVEMEVRGLVFAPDGKLISKGFSYTPEYSSDISFHNAEHKFNAPNDTRTVFRSHEGVVLRVFAYNGKWYISTHRRLNAYRSRWGSDETFGELFDQGMRNLGLISDDQTCLQWFADNLDDTYTYAFLISNTPNNRLVCHAPKDIEIIHIGTFGSDGTYWAHYSCPIPKAKEYNFDSDVEMLEAVEKIDHMKHQGFVIFNADGPVFKLFHPTYYKLWSLRNNVSSIKLRYLQIIGDEEKSRTFRDLYPENKKDFDQYDKYVEMVANEGACMYNMRFVCNRKAHVRQELYQLLLMCENVYTCGGAGVHERLTSGDVKSIFYRMDSPQKNKLIRSIHKAVTSDPPEYRVWPDVTENEWGYTLYTDDEGVTYTERELWKSFTPAPKNPVLKKKSTKKYSH